MSVVKLEGLFTYIDKYNRMVLCLFDEYYIEKLKNCGYEQITEYGKTNNPYKRKASIRIKIPKENNLNIIAQKYISQEISVKVKIKNYNFTNKEGEQIRGKSLVLQNIT
jgi:uncharacterized membrane-anchored protein